MQLPLVLGSRVQRREVRADVRVAAAAEQPDEPRAAAADPLRRLQQRAGVCRVGL